MFANYTLTLPKSSHWDFTFLKLKPVNANIIQKKPHSVIPVTIRSLNKKVKIKIEEFAANPCEDEATHSGL